MHTTSANELLQGTILLTVPHYDDEILGCGGTLAQLDDPTRVYVIFITAGDALPIMTANEEDRPPDIENVRRKESCDALQLLGIPMEHLIFLNIPENTVGACQELLQQKLCDHITRIKPDTILTPFRYDQHRDHIMLNKITRSIAKSTQGSKVIEYFVYYNYPLLPKKDIRKYCHPSLLYQVNTSRTAAVKKEALQLFITQTTLYYPAQCRPVLSPQLINEYAETNEYFLIAEENTSHVCYLPGPLLRFTQLIQPLLKRQKEKLRFFLSKNNNSTY